MPRREGKVAREAHHPAVTYLLDVTGECGFGKTALEPNRPPVPVVAFVPYPHASGGSLTEIEGIPPEALLRFSVRLQYVDGRTEDLRVEPEPDQEVRISLRGP